MANISDGYGNVLVERVGHDLKEFLQVVQKDAYYELFDDIDNMNPDSNGDVEFTFGAGGRWNYEANIRGYLEGEWMNGEAEQKAYNKFIRAFKKKDGLISIEYTDSDTSMDWMGEGEYNMSVCDGEIVFGHDFQEEHVTLERYAEQNGESTRWALEYIYGDEIAGQYDDYVAQCEKEGKEPVEPENWYGVLSPQEV